MNAQQVLLAVVGLLFAGVYTRAADRVVYEGETGPGKGKHILFIASDHEYRGEETCPAIARIMAKRFGFKCTVLFGQTPDGLIKQGSSRIPGIEAIDNADMLFLFLRFVHPEDAWMERLENYLTRGGPVLGLRTTTHAFNGLKGKYAYHNFSYRGDEFVGGFGRQILGETWNPKLGAGHYGNNHKYATAMNVLPKQKDHPDHAWRQGNACDGRGILSQADARLNHSCNQPCAGVNGGGIQAAGGKGSSTRRMVTEVQI